MVAIATIVTAAFLVLTAVEIGQGYFNAKQAHEDAGETVDAVNLLSESLDNLVADIVNVLQDFAAALQDFATAIMQYMDIWGIVIISCVAVVGIISFLNLVLYSRRSRH